MGNFVRISSLIWADILVGYALFVMQKYLTDVWGLSFTHSAAILNLWSGMCLVLPGFCLYLADTCLGHRGMLVLSSVSYSTGIAFISMSTPPVLANATGMCKEYEANCIGHTQRVLFYTGMALVAVGKSGNEVSYGPFLEEQFDGEIDIVAGQGLGFIFVVVVSIAGSIGLPYVKPWSISFGIPAICTTFAMLFFFTGLHQYRSSGPQGSPINNVFRVFYASATKICRPFPLTARLYRRENEREDDRFPRTRFLRCLERAALYNPRTDDENNKCRVCSVAEVEEAKIAVRMIPMWVTFIICGVVSSIGNTYFVEQASHMSRRVGKWNTNIQMLLLFRQYVSEYFEQFATLVSGYSTYRDPNTGRGPNNGTRPAFGIGFGMILSILCCITAARIENMRLNVVIRHDLLDSPDADIPMSMYWLLFQFFLLAGVDAFLQKSIVAFYAYQAPKSMEDYLEHFTNGVRGLGVIFSVVTVYVVGQVSAQGGKTNWFQFTLNRSRLDKYYWVLAALSAVNFAVFVVVAFLYRYQDCEPTIEEDDAYLDDAGYDVTIECSCW